MTPYWTSRDGRHVLYHGDCLAVLPTLQPGTVDAVVTDPPYGIGMANGMGGGGGGICPRNPKAYNGQWDAKRPAPAAFVAILAAAKTAIIWGGNYFADLLPKTDKWLIWDKQQTMPSYSDAELAWTSLSGSSTKMLRLSGNGMFAAETERHHPTQKPVALMQWCLGFLPAGCTVLDPYTGSGSTAIACIRTGRRFIGVELEERYCAIAVRRMEAELAQPMLIAPEPPKETQQELI